MKDRHQGAWGIIFLNQSKYWTEDKIHTCMLKWWMTMSDNYSMKHLCSYSWESNSGSKQWRKINIFSIPWIDTMYILLSLVAMIVMFYVCQINIFPCKENKSQFCWSSLFKNTNEIIDERNFDFLDMSVVLFRNT